MKLFGFSLFPLVLAFFAVMAEEMPDDVRLRLEKAREDVALATATEARISERLAALESDEDASEEAVAAMRVYRDEVGRMRAGYEAALLELEALAEEIPDPAVAEGMRSFSESLAALPEAESGEEDELARMIAEFDASLTAFDGVIHDHLAGVRSRMDRRMEVASAEAGPRARAAAEAAELLRSMGVDPGIPGETEGESAGEQTAGEQTSGTQTAGTQSGGVQSGGTQSGGTRAGSRNEDIVARQLREAAEKETDPELREKLWKEYEAYLDGRS